MNQNLIMNPILHVCFTFKSQPPKADSVVMCNLSAENATLYTQHKENMISL